jgi:23S rRNA-/tRNA-specific pseudouridylate synthase
MLCEESALRPVRLAAVNRLDRLTSGLLVLPLTSAGAAALSEEFREGRVRKEYLARVKGRFPECVALVILLENDGC